MSEDMIYKEETMYICLPQVNVAVKPRIVQKVLQNVLHTFFFGSFSLTRVLCVEKIGKILKYMTERMEKKNDVRR